MRLGRGAWGLGLLAALAPGVAAQEEASEPAPEPGAFAEVVLPLVQAHCVRCHGAEEPKAGVDLTRFADAQAVGRDRKTWERVITNLEAGVMPPEGEPQPAEEQVSRAVAWLEGWLKQAACDGPPDPGHVTLRRLNRTEYNNTIRDLLGVDVRPADDFPADDVGYGFDNIGDVLTLSPLLLEKYLAAAERVAARAIVVDRTRPGPRRTWRGRELRRAGGESYGEDGRILSSTGEVRVRHRFPAAGAYTLRARAWGHQAGDEPVKMAFRLDGRDLATVDVPAVEGDAEIYEVRLEAEAGAHELAVAFVNDYYEPDDPDPARRGDRNLIVEMMEVQGPIEVDEGPLPDSHRRLIPREPSGPQEVRACAREALGPLATRAFRRPVMEEELDRLADLVEATVARGEPYARGMQLALQAILVSPSFLFHTEAGPGELEAGSVRDLDDYELASRLSYFLWSSMPDEELFRLAERGALRDESVLIAQARRMLEDERAGALVEGFGMQWLQLRNLATFQPDRTVFPTFDEGLRADMLTETRRTLEHVMRGDRSILELLDADYAFLNERLAKHYGVPGVSGEEFRRVELPDGRRGGLLTQASVLAVTSNPARTSPVKRGKWVLEQILGEPPPPPPPDVPQLNESSEAILSGSLRERLERHRSDPGCAVCHDRLDPLGFVFENYDALGAWREKDGEFPIDASGELPSGDRFRGPEEFKAYLLSRRDRFARCLTEKLLTYALGRGLEAEDACVVDEIAKSLADHEYRFSRLVTGIVASVPFRQTRVPGVQP